MKGGDYMKNKQLGSFLGVIGLLMLTVSAQATTVYNADVTGVNGGHGSYHVVITKNVGNSFTVTSAHSNTTSNAGANPNSDASLVRLSFYDSAGVLIHINTALPATQTALGTAGTAGGNFVVAGTPTSGYTIQWLNNAETVELQADGTNVFSQTGSINLSTYASKIGVQLTDGGVGGQTFFTNITTPEASSLALLLPGLLPLGFGVRRRLAKSRA
jgi:hypothetical protein